MTPQFGASFCIRSRYYAIATAVMGLLFNVLSQRAWGRQLLLTYPGFFTLGLFSEDGPTEEMLHKTSWKTTFVGRGWANASPDTVPGGGFDLVTRTSVSGPEPGYIATSIMFAILARTVLEDAETLPATGGVFTPGALIGMGGVAAVRKLVARLCEAGIQFKVEEAPKTVVPKAD